jgi:hypothetical protein
MRDPLETVLGLVIVVLGTIALIAPELAQRFQTSWNGGIMRAVTRGRADVRDPGLDPRTARRLYRIVGGVMLVGGLAVLIGQ